MAYLIPYFMMPSYAQTVLGRSAAEGSYALITSQAASVPGRLLAALAANYLGVMFAWSGCALISGIVCFAWIGVSGYPGFLAFCAFYGKSIHVCVRPSFQYCLARIHQREYRTAVLESDFKCPKLEHEWSLSFEHIQPSNPPP